VKRQQIRFKHPFWNFGPFQAYFFTISGLPGNNPPTPEEGQGGFP
jgi:hypothetical protein